MFNTMETSKTKQRVMLNTMETFKSKERDMRYSDNKSTIFVAMQPELQRKAVA